jgi:hypothetical protein
MAIDMLRSRWARAACAGGCRGSRVARAIVRRRSGSAVIDCRSRLAQIAGGSGRATGRRPVSRSVRSAPLRAVPSCASAAVSGASLTVASMAGSSARPATSSTATRRARARGVGRSRHCSGGCARRASSVRGLMSLRRALARGSPARSPRFSAISRGRRTRGRCCGGSVARGSGSPAGCSPARSRSVTLGLTRPRLGRRTRSRSFVRSS